MTQEDAFVTPQNAEAEDSILGVMLLGDQDSIGEAAELLRRKDFYRPSNGAIFETIVDLDAKGEKVDAITLAAELDRRGWLEKVGGKFRIHELASLAPPRKMVRYHAAIVKEMAVRRGLVTAGRTIAHTGERGLGDATTLLSEAEAALSTVTNDTISSDFYTLGDSADELVADILDFAERGEERYGLKTGYPTLDRLTTGLHGGDVVVLAARPSVGKSALAQNIATRITSRGIGVLFLTLEMSRNQLAVRQLSTLTGIEASRLVLAQLDLHEQAKLKEAKDKLKKLPFYVEDDASMRLPELRAKVRRQVRQHPDIGLLIVDYLQLMLGSETPESRQQEVASISRGLKILAKELNIPILALSQLNRGLESRENKRPLLSDLRDSGAIEQDADMVWMLYRESLYKNVKDEDANDTELLIRKNRMNEPGLVRLTFVKKKELYSEPAMRKEA